MKLYSVQHVCIKADLNPLSLQLPFEISVNAIEVIVAPDRDALVLVARGG